jgi:hypothetical protein
MSYVDIVICIGSLPILETWPPIYRGQERRVRDRLKASQVYPHVYFQHTPCLTDFTFEFIRRPISPILSPLSRTFVELTLVNKKTNNLNIESESMLKKIFLISILLRLVQMVQDIVVNINQRRLLVLVRFVWL